MNWLDRYVIEPLWPQAALKRAQARRMVNALYEAATYEGMRKNPGRRGSADQHNKPAQRNLLEHARYLDTNYDIFSGALDTLVNNTVGSGLVPEFHVKNLSGELATDVNDHLSELWEDWVKHPEVTGEYDYYTAQRLQARSLYRDGEIFTQHVQGVVSSLQHNTKVPYSLEFLESEMIPAEYDDDSRNIVQGVQKNEWGKPLSYKAYKKHPSEMYQGSIYTDLKTIDAERVTHLKLTKRFRQTRGISIAASVITRFDDIKEIEESERVAARVAAAIAGYIRKGNPDMYDMYMDSGSEIRDIEFAPGMIMDDLGPGESLEVPMSQRPNNQVILFRDANMRAAASGLAMTYSSLAKDYNGTYSAQRQELVENHQNTSALSAYFAGKAVAPVVMRFMQAAYNSGLVILPRDVNPVSVFAVDIVPPQMPWIDPKKEAEAWTTLLDYGLESRTHISRQRGRNPQKIKEQIEREKDWPTAQKETSHDDTEEK